MTSPVILIIGGLVLIGAAVVIIVILALIQQNRQADRDSPASPTEPIPMPPPPVVQAPVTPAGQASGSDLQINDLEPRVRVLMAAGKKIEAIKLYREITGAGLKEAKDAVEALESGLPLAGPGNSIPASYSIASPDLEQQIQDQLARDNKIEAIKLYRQLTGAGLKEAKDAVESMDRGTYLDLPANPETISAAQLPQDLEQRVRDLIATGNKIEAIKLYREATHVGLKEAKDAVDAIQANS